MAKDYVITATSRWSKDDRMGVEFARPLEMDAGGRISVRPPQPERTRAESILLRKAG
jgi:hypothetical protein